MIRILNNVYGTNGWGNHSVVLAAGVHEESPETLRQVALGNGVHVDAPAPAVEVAPPAEAPAAEAPAAEAAPTEGAAETASAPAAPAKSKRAAA